MQRTRISSCLLAALMACLTGCYIQSDLTLDAQAQDLELKQVLISMDAVPEIVEASIRQALVLLGLDDAFLWQAQPESESGKKAALLLKPRARLRLPQPMAGDRISVTAQGEQKHFEWLLAPRAEIFAQKLEHNPELDNKVFLVIRITFPGPVVRANTPESEGHTYTWRITQSQLTKPYKISADYR